MVRHIGLGICVAMVVGCSDGHVRAGAQEPIATASADPEAGAETDLTSGQPTVLFRCEDGRIGAYVVTADLEGEPTEGQMVRISLDSAPRC